MGSLWSSSGSNDSYQGSTSGGFDPSKKAYLDNRANQCNPNHTSTGPGRSAKYGGTGTKADLDNHSRQLNPNNSRYNGPR